MEHIEEGDGATFSPQCSSVSDIIRELFTLNYYLFYSAFFNVKDVLVPFQQI